MAEWLAGLFQGVNPRHQSLNHPFSRKTATSKVRLGGEDGDFGEIQIWGGTEKNEGFPTKSPLEMVDVLLIC